MTAPSKKTKAMILKEYDELSVRFIELEKDYFNLDKELSLLKSVYAQLEKEHSSVIEERDAARDKNKFLAKSIVNLEEELRLRNHLLQSRDDEIDNLTLENNRLKNVEEMLQASTDYLVKENTHLQKRVEELQEVDSISESMQAAMEFTEAKEDYTLDIVSETNGIKSHRKYRRMYGWVPEVQEGRQMRLYGAIPNKN